jgi:hypothetical protein
MAARLINVIFKTKCCKCGNVVPEGARAWYDKAAPKGRRTTHEDCGQPNAANAANAAQAPQPQAPRAERGVDAPIAAQNRAQDAAGGLAARFPQHKEVHAYEDVEALLRATENPRNECRAWRAWKDGQGGASPDWLGLEPELGVDVSLRNVARVIRTGWTRGAERIEKALGGLTVDAQPRSIRRVRTRREFGSEVDITEYWRGRGDKAWTDCTRAARPSRLHYTIVNDALDSGGATADSLFWRGAAVVALADKLTAAGYSVRVVSAWQAANRGGVVCYTVCKPFDAPVDLPTLAASCAHPAFFRA